MGMASCRHCTHSASQFLPVRKPVHDPGVHWIPPVALFLVSRAFTTVCSAVFFGCNHFHVSCSNSKSSTKLADCNDYSKRRGTLFHLASPRAGASIFLCDILPKDARQFLQSLEMNLSCIATHAAMQEWLHVAQAIGPQLRLKVLGLYGESPVDGLQDVG